MKCLLIYSCCSFVGVHERQIKTLNSVLKRDIFILFSVVFKTELLVGKLTLHSTLILQL
jgi:hypothetical protein